MEIGINIPSSHHAWKIAQRAEELGFCAVNLWDSPLVCGDPFAAMGAIAVKTSRIRIGNSIYVPANRDPAVTASGLATLNGLAPGRIDFIAGTGFSARRVYGRPPMTRKAFERHILQVVGLLNGELVTFGDGEKARDVKLVHRDVGVFNAKDPIPVTIGAAGPKLQQFTAENGFNWLNGISVFGSAAESAGQMDKAWTAAGRDVKDLRKNLLFAGCLLRPGETISDPRVRAIAGPMAAVTLHYWVDAEKLQGQDVNPVIPDNIQPVMDGYRDMFETFEPGTEHWQIHTGHSLFLRPNEDKLITDDAIKTLTFTGTKDELKARFEDFERAGVDQLDVAITHGHEDTLEDWAEFFELKPR